MHSNRGIVESIMEAGNGSEAQIFVQLRTSFPGLGGTIVTPEGVAAALRVEYNQSPKSGHKIFLRHLVAKKLDDHFYRTGVYVFSHVPRVLGSTSIAGDQEEEAYIYEWAFGSDGFPWTQGDGTPIELRDWNRFSSSFSAVGVHLEDDVTTPEDEYAQNIVHQYPSCAEAGVMCSLWKRIDYGEKSARYQYDKLTQYLCDNEDALVLSLRWDRYEMLCDVVRYLADPDSMSEYHIGQLEQRIGSYRRSSLRHYAFGFGPAGGQVGFETGRESLV